MQESTLLSHLPTRDAAGRRTKHWLSGASGTAKLPIKYWLGMAYRPAPATSCSLLIEGKLIVGKLINPCREMGLGGHGRARVSTQRSWSPR
jgi:hypothetical protein